MSELTCVNPYMGCGWAKATWFKHLLMVHHALSLNFKLWGYNSKADKFALSLILNFTGRDE